MALFRFLQFLMIWHNVGSTLYFHYKFCLVTSCSAAKLSLITDKYLQLFRQAEFNFHVKACIFSIIITGTRIFARLKLVASPKTKSVYYSEASH